MKSSQLRHALRTPLNQIAGYSDMLIEDLQCNGNDAVREALQRIRESGRAILSLLQEEMPPNEPEITPDHLQRLRARMQPPLDIITTDVGRIAFHSRASSSQLNLADVLRIGTAAAELVEFTTCSRTISLTTESAPDGHAASSALITGDVLVVDDNPANCDLLSRMLERHGLNSWTAPDGLTALERVDQRRFDLILLDLMMPGMNGLEVLERLKSDPERRSIPVIMLSASDETSRVIQCLEIGAEDYVVKPFDQVLLLARLRSTLERNRLREAETVRARELEVAYERLRENEARLQESEERLRLATEAAEVGIWYFYPAVNRVLMTPVCKRLFGLPADDSVLTFDQMAEHIHPEERERVEAEKQRAIEDGSEYDIEFRVIYPDRSVHWLSTRGSSQWDGTPGDVRLAGVALDISTRKEAQEAVLQAHKLESIGLLAGGIAHDFNNLLTGIIGSASFVIDNLRDGDPNADMLRNVVNAGERAADLTRQLLAYSGKGKFSVQRLDLSKLVAEIAVLLRASMSRAVTLDRHLPEGLPFIEGDATQIQQIVMNLVINGSEAIAGEGAVSVSTGLVALGPGSRESFVVGEEILPGNYIYLEVTDTGSGMTPEILNKIFEPFFTTKFTGRGLGLAAVFGIVRGHDGALEVRSTPGAGSTFRVFFPIVPGQTVHTPKTEGAHDTKVLFVDDESVVRLMGKTALERAGFVVLLAITGEDALRIVQQYRDDIALAILDMTMPGWSGFETYHRLKQVCPTLPVLLSSGYSEEEIRSRYPGEKFNGLLQKPYSASSLVARVNETLGVERAV